MYFYAIYDKFDKFPSRNTSHSGHSTENTTKNDRLIRVVFPLCQKGNSNMASSTDLATRELKTGEK